MSFKIDETPILIVVAGDRNSSLRLTIDELEKYSNCKEWVDVVEKENDPSDKFDQSVYMVAIKK